MILSCMQVQALIQGRASAWQQNLILTPTKGGAGDPVKPDLALAPHFRTTATEFLQ